MIVYGDRSRLEDPQGKLGRITARAGDAAALPPGLDRHAALVDAFVEAGELLQGVADAAFEARGVDDASPAQDAAMALLLMLADAVRRSWDGGLAAPPPDLGGPAEDLARCDLPAEVRVRTSEGHAFYGVYPEAYALAAARTGLARPPVAVGLRSIGTGLAAMVATGAGSTTTATLRPHGDPFARRVRIGPGLRARLLADADADYVIVDEGPGLSGSSFMAATDWLEAAGVAPDRITCLAGHDRGPGGQASERTRRRWAAGRVVAASSGDVAERVLSSLEDLVGRAEQPPQDLSAGAWRALRPAPAPSAPALERRKWLLRTSRGVFLARFAGLGRLGRDKLARAQRLHEAGFAPEPAGLRHGLLVERWVEGRPVDPDGSDRGRLLDAVGRYLGFRARAFPATHQDGASARQLVDMVERNAGLTLGTDAGARARSLAAALAPAARRARPAHIDGRLHAWEWIAAGDRLVKTDAVDHSVGHDLVGCQDIAWDVAGAVVELDLDEGETRRLCAVVEREAGRPVDAGLLELFGLCYPAFQLGLWSFGEDHDRAVRNVRQRYERRLGSALASQPHAPPERCREAG